MVLTVEVYREYTDGSSRWWSIQRSKKRYGGGLMMKDTAIEAKKEVGCVPSICY